jgi:hypothetical protein
MGKPFSNIRRSDSVVKEANLAFVRDRGIASMDTNAIYAIAVKKAEQ